MLDNGSEPSFPLPLASIFRKTLMNSVIKLVNHVPFYLQYQMLYGVGGRTLPVKKAYVFHPVGELYSAPDLFSAASSVQRICRRSEPPVLLALSQGAATVPVLGNLNLTDLQTIRQEACEESWERGPDLRHLPSLNNKVIFSLCRKLDLSL